MNTCLAAFSCDSQAASKNCYGGGSAHAAFRQDENRRNAENGKCEIGKLILPAFYQNRNGSIIIRLDDQRFSKSDGESGFQSHRKL